MKKHSQTTTVYRIDHEKGNYTTISRNVLISTELTDSAKTLLQLCLNNAPNWKLVLSHYKKILNWSNDKMANAVSNLIEYGFLRKEKYPNGKGKGFTYSYIVSEFGNLNPNREKPSKKETVEKTAPTQLDSKSISNLEVIEEEEDSAKTLTTYITNEEHAAISEILLKLMGSTKISDDYLAKLSDYYVDKFTNGDLTVATLNIENEILSIKAKIEKNVLSKMKIIEQWIDFHNNKGTKAQRDNIKARAFRYFKELSSPIDEIIERDVSTRILKLKSSVIDTNRVYDSKYQD
jgi:predicted transcriptional regulator